jgi:glutamine synthetase
MQITEPVDINTYNLTPEQEKQLGIMRLPSNLSIALDEMKKDPYVREVLGDHIFDKYVSAKEKEWALYNNAVHSWEIESYLAAY